ncbi:MarR family transcriptional regulator [Micromonospora sp. NPDC049559]|uniref:MarR family winged helix-turn-helix transcriptional regulator n=1 Tax=Micromonospora sp. NPDC049559 TaxID=3155923 RepID=UPI003430D370
MSTYPDPGGSESQFPASVETAAGSLLSVWDASRERISSQLSASQLRALMVVDERDGINLRGLAASLGMLLSSASRLCDRLVAAGVLEREPGQHDRREIALHLTGAGQALLDELRGYRRERLATVLDRMSVTGRRALLRGLWEFDAALRAELADQVAGEGDAVRSA